jgi:hypothetical protein
MSRGKIIAIPQVGGLHQPLREMRRMNGRGNIVTVNRSALVVKPRQPLLDWLNAVDPTNVNLTLREVIEDPTIYLIPECDTDDELRRILRRVCEYIFAEQLAGWYTDESVWPQDRSFEAFCRRGS